MPSDERIAACHNRTEARGYRPPRDDERDSLDLCGFCFPEGEVDVDEDELLVPELSRPRSHIHRDADSDGTDWLPDGAPSRTLARVLQREDVTDPTDSDVADVLGGGGDGA